MSIPLDSISLDFGVVVKLICSTNIELNQPKGITKGLANLPKFGRTTQGTNGLKCPLNVLLCVTKMGLVVGNLLVDFVHLILL